MSSWLRRSWVKPGRLAGGRPRSIPLDITCGGLRAEAPGHLDSKAGK